MGEQIACTPSADGQDRFLMAEGLRRDYAGLFRLVTGYYNFGGGEGNQPSLTPLLRFEIQGVAFAA
jgi:hypothetical protein